MSNKRMDYMEAMELLINRVNPVEIEDTDLEKCIGRVLAVDITAGENVPSFDRSPYDGYAFQAADTADASKERPVTLRVLENIRAGQMPVHEVVSGTAIRLMTGAPVPAGADAVCKYEDTSFTDSSVTLKMSYCSGENVVTAGEDIKQGTLVLKKGYRIDPGMEGTLASLGVMRVPVYRKPLAGILSTGDEVVEAGEQVPPGKIRNSNRYTISAALQSIGFETVYLGQVEDTVEAISERIRQGEEGTVGRTCDVLISTGGVSVGDYDLVPDAMEACGYELLTRGVAMKPGMACAFGVGKRLMLGLSGNPASSLTNLQCVCFPALRKMTGLAEYGHKVFRMKLGNDILKTGKGTRFVRGRTVIRDGEIYFESPSEQGNVVISSASRCNAYGVLTGMKAPVAAGTMIDVFLTGGLTD